MSVGSLEEIIDEKCAPPSIVLAGPERCLHHVIIRTVLAYPAESHLSQPRPFYPQAFKTCF